MVLEENLKRAISLWWSITWRFFLVMLFCTVILLLLGGIIYAIIYFLPSFNYDLLGTRIILETLTFIIWAAVSCYIGAMVLLQILVYVRLLQKGSKRYNIKLVSKKMGVDLSPDFVSAIKFWWSTAWRNFLICLPFSVGIEMFLENNIIKTLMQLLVSTIVSIYVLKRLLDKGSKGFNIVLTDKKI